MSQYPRKDDTYRGRPRTIPRCNQTDDVANHYTNDSRQDSKSYFPASDSRAVVSCEFLDTSRDEYSHDSRNDSKDNARINSQADFPCDSRSDSRRPSRVDGRGESRDPTRPMSWSRSRSYSRSYSRAVSRSRSRSRSRDVYISYDDVTDEDSDDATETSCEGVRVL